MEYQATKGIVTIDGILFKAMLESNWITHASYKKLKKIKYQHASRTDKGVSAARQCCSILLRKFTATFMSGQLQSIINTLLNF